MTTKEIYEAIKNNPAASLYKELFTTNIFGETVPVKGRTLEVIDGKVQVLSDGTEDDFENSFLKNDSFFNLKKTSTNAKSIPKGRGITSEKLAWYRENNMLVGEQYDRLAKKGDKRKEEEKNKILSIKYLSFSADDKNYNLTFEITATNLKKFDATIFVQEMNATNEETVNAKIKLSSKQKSNVTVSFDKNKQFDRYFWQDRFVYQATITCDGISEKTEEFTLVSKKTESNKTKQEECLCKKREYTADDLKDIVTQLRKLDTRLIKRFDVHEGSNHVKWYDKDGKLIPNTSSGDKPKNGKERRLIDKSFSFFEDLAEDHKLNGDRLFIKNSNELNVKDSEKNYKEFAKQINNTLKKYDINTCIRKIHFFAQLYHETQRLTTTYETDPSSSVSGGDYYRGRGLVHLTHDYNYLHYYDYRFNKSFFKSYLAHRVGYESVNQFNTRTENKYISVDEMKKVDEFIKLVSTEFFYACDTAGWYWKEYKINTFADKDDLINVSAIINNPSAKNVTSTTNIRGYDERRKYYDLMKIIFDYENCK